MMPDGSVGNMAKAPDLEACRLFCAAHSHNPASFYISIQECEIFDKNRPGKCIAARVFLFVGNLSSKSAEGIVKTVVKDNKAAIVEVNSETDFVAKNDEFQGFVEAVANQVVDSEAADLDAFMAEAWEADTTKTVKDALVEKLSLIHI